MKHFNGKGLLLSLAILLTGYFNAQATRFYAIASGDWNSKSTWSTSPTGTTAASAFPALSGDTVYIGQGATGYTINIPDNVTMTAAEIFIGSNAAATSSSISLAGAGSVLTVSGNITIIKPSGSATNALVVNAGTVTVNGNMTLDGTVTTSNRAARVAITTGSLTINGNLAFTAGSAANNVIDMTGGAGKLILKGAWTGTVGTLNSSTTSQVRFESTTAAQTIPVFLTGGYNDIYVNNNSATGATLAGALTATNLKGNIIIGDANTGSKFNTGNFAITLNNTKGITLSENSLFNAGTSVMTFGTGGTAAINGYLKTSNTAGLSGATTTLFNSTNTPTVTLGANSTVEYNSNGAQSVTARADYAALILSGSGAKTMAGTATTATINKDLTASGGGFADGGKAITVKGNIVNSVAFTGAGKIVLSGGSVAHNLSGTGGSFTNLELNDALGAELSADVQIVSTLTLTAGKITTGSNYLISGSSNGANSSILGGGAGRYIYGNLRKFIPSTANPAVNLIIGDLNNYTPITLNFSGTPAAGGSLNVSTIAAQPPVESGISQTKYINRKWAVNVNTALTGYTSYSATFTFVAGDLVGAPTTTAASLVIRRLTGGVWYPTTIGTVNSSSAQATGLSSFSEFYIGEIEATPITINSQPTDSSICQGFNASFTASASSTFAPTVKWQRSSDNGTTWVDITGTLDNTNTTYSNFTTNTLTLTNPKIAISGYKYRAVYTNINGSTNTNAATLTVQDKPVSVTITSSDADNSICENTSVTFTATPVNGGSNPVYAWFLNNVEVTGVTGNTYTTTTLANGDKVKVVLTSDITPCASGNPDTSNIITTVVSPIPTAAFATTANNSPVCSGKNALFYLTGTSGGVVTYKVNGGASSTVTLTGGAATVTVSGVTATTSLEIISVTSNGCSNSFTGLTSTVTIVQNSSSSTPITACNSYLWNGSTYTTSGTYTKTLVNAAGCDSIATLVLTINKTLITTQPVGGGICAGGNITLSVAATGQGTITYQWKKDNVDISGATNASYIATATGTYTVVVSSDCGPVTSANAVVTNKTPTSITTEPLSGSICTGTSLNLNVVAAGQGTLTYQWRKDSVNISGATAATYAANQTGNYYVVVTGECGSVNSQTAVVTLKTATSITTQPVGATICPGTSTTLSVVAGGNGTITYQWRNNGTPITGATTSSYVATTAGTYSVVVTADCGSVTSANAVVTLKVTTAITTQPINSAFCTGATTTLSVVATGTAVTYQWKKDTVAITGATAATYTTNVVGNYSVVVKGDCGTVTSNTVTVSQKVATAITTQPKNGGVCPNGSYLLNVVATGDGTLTYQWRKDGVNITGALASSYSATATGTYSVVVTGGCGSVTSTNAVVTTLGTTTNKLIPDSLYAETSNDNAPIELGMKFFSSVNGYITHIRFYKYVYLGNFTVSLWDVASKTRIATAPVMNSTIGWNTVELPNPVAITANTLYMASYYSATGDYYQKIKYFDSTRTSGYLTAPAGTATEPNGTYRYGSTGFPDQPKNNSIFYVDVLFTTCLAKDITAPQVSGKLPLRNAVNVPVNQPIKAYFSENMTPSTVNNQSFYLLNAQNQQITGTVTFDTLEDAATLTLPNNLAYNNTYTVVLKGGTATNAIKDKAGNPLATDNTWSFKTPPSVPMPLEQGYGGPVLILTSGSNSFTKYYAEILRAEGMNNFSARDINTVTIDTLNRYDAVLLGEATITAAQVTLLTTWVNSGGTLVTFKPDTKLYGLLGITSANATVTDKYLTVDTTSGPGMGIVGESIQFHGSANLFTLSGAKSLANIYTTATSSSPYPAVSYNVVGTNGGKAIAFAFDLARSIVYTRQGNPAWAGTKRDGIGLTVRSDDMFFGNSATDPQPDWIDFNKIQIPQADEQQHFLANIITQGIMHRKPMPRFWILPKKYKAAVIMTGDDHGNSGTIGRFNDELNYGNNTAQDVLDWKAVRSTSFIYPINALTEVQANDFISKGFELSLHINTLCGLYDSKSLNYYYRDQADKLQDIYPSLPAPTTNRTHCIVWNDWLTKTKVETLFGVRLNTDYYYWPASWVQNRPGMFTGSGMPMRFADLDGTMYDNYQVTTQMTDESGLVLPGYINTLLDNALGNKGYYGVFCANMHTDYNSDTDPPTIQARLITDAAVAKNVPVISAKQMLTWLDGRNTSYFSNMNWTGNVLNFNIAAGTGSYNLNAMLPVDMSRGKLTGITLNGAPLAYTTEVIKGVNYAFFNASTGNFAATYAIDNTPPAITDVTVTPSLDGSATITWTTDEKSDTKINYGVTQDLLNNTTTNFVSTMVTTHSTVLTGLTPGATYYFRVYSADANSNLASYPSLQTAPLSFTMPGSPCFLDNTFADFNGGTTGNSSFVATLQDGEVKLKPVAAADFTILPSETEWKSFTWTGGNSTLLNGALVVNGARFNTEPATLTFAPGAVMEFVATFRAESAQSIGFGGGTDAAGAITGGIFNGPSPWAIFTTENQATILRTSVFTGTGGPVTLDIPGSAALLGTTHRYRIEWKTTSIDFFVDDIIVNSEEIGISAPMRAAISDYNFNATGITVDWIYVYPYSAAGSFTSRVFDAGIVKLWKNMLWSAQVPAGTSLLMEYRKGNTATPDTTWSTFTAVPATNTILDATSRYIQYRATMTTSNGKISPVIGGVGISCTDAPSFAPDVTKNPDNVILCVNDTAKFSSIAIGMPLPTAQWQSSADTGKTWSDIVIGSKETFSFITSATDNNKLYRVIWTNSSGSDTSGSAKLTVSSSTGTLSLSNLCTSSKINLTYTPTLGVGPYSLLINDSLYTNIAAGVPFSTNQNKQAPAETVWSNKLIGSAPGAVDNAAVELGFKFRANVAGQVTGVRFYKLSGNTGTHTGSLWTASGILLAKATFTNETATGWQQVDFATPVTITPGITYVASYYAPVGNYAYADGVFNVETTNLTGSLTAFRATDVGGNGLYVYGGGFPNNVSGANGSYFVDVVFRNSLNQSKFLLTRITSSTGCVTNGSPIYTLNANLAPLALAASKTSLVCLENTDASLTLTGVQGNAPYYFSIDSGVTFNNSGNFTNLAAGKYKVRIKDVANCTVDTTIAIDVDKATWTGALSSDWHTAANWSGNKVPSSTTHVIVPLTPNACVISNADAFAASVQLSTGATIQSLNNRKLSLSGKCLTLPPQ